MKQSAYQTKIHQAVHEAKEELLNTIARHYGVAVPVQLAPPEAIFMGAQGSFEGGKIKINRHLPLFWQLLILEHEIGHYFVLAGKSSGSNTVFRSFQTHPMSSEEQRAWEWVEKNPIAPGSFIDKAVRSYIQDLKKIGQKLGHTDDIMRLGWWY